MSQLKILSAAAWLMYFLGSAQPGRAQGTFVNFETPQTHPIETFVFSTRPYVVVCNTPANTIEVYRAASSNQFVGKVPVGMGPSSVRWNPSNQKLYVTNFDGDSVSRVGVAAAGTSIALTLEETTSLDAATGLRIGDEPSDIAFGTVLVGGNPVNRALITLSSSSSVQWLDPATLTPIDEPEALAVPGSVRKVVRSPRYLEWLPDGRQFIANLSNSMRANSDPELAYDIAGCQVDATGATAVQALLGLGTTIHALAADADNDLLFVVGTRAQNQAAIGEAAVSALATGFVQSWLWVLDISGTTPTVHAEPVAGSTGPYAALPSINLNRDYAVNGLVAIATSQAMSQPTGIELIEDGGEVTRILITGFHSDRIAVLVPNSSIARGYNVSYLDVAVDPLSDYSMVGPRGVVYSPAVGRAFVNGRLDNSLIVFDPFNPTITDPDFNKKPLNSDPTPSAIRVGREFLYSSRFSIDDSTPSALTGGFVSCASCHVDGRTDNHAWNLGVNAFGPESDADELDPLLLDPTPGLFENFSQFFPAPPTWAADFAFPIDKGPIVTQTLQGLVNYQLNHDFQHVATNAPYYWRAARSFSDFNKAFVNLQGMDDLAGGGVDGITSAEMEDFEEFINTIRHPPNPEQSIDRLPSGALGTENPNDPATASGALKGMQQFHNTAQALGTGAAARSCVDCHSLPDGSSNTLTMMFPIPRTLTNGTAQVHPMETPGLRNITSRERVKHENSITGFGPWTSTVDYIKSYEGLFHSGGPESTTPGFPNQSSWSINNFVHNNFSFAPLDPTTGTDAEAEVTEFVRQFDRGTAPAAGVAFTVDPSQQSFSQFVAAFLEDQAEEGNIGLAAITRNNGVVAGYWYDIANSSPSAAGVYTPEVGASSTLSKSQLLDLSFVSGQVVVLQATSLGADRLVASLGAGASTINQGDAANNVVLRPMAPNVAYKDVAKFNGNLHYSYSPPSAPLLSSSETSIWTQRILQHEVAESANKFGVTGVHHEPPRRFRVTGNNIRAGARMVLYMATGTTPMTNPEPTLEMELYPTKYQANGMRIWETYVELDATQTFALLCGGYSADGVADVLGRTYDPSSATADAIRDLNPDAWNSFQVRIVNEGGTQMTSPTGWQQLKVQDHRGNP